MGLCLTVRDKDIVKIGDVFISLEKSGNAWRILINAPKDVHIERLETHINDRNEFLYKQIKRNKNGKNN